MTAAGSGRVAPMAALLASCCLAVLLTQTALAQQACPRGKTYDTSAKQCSLCPAGTVKVPDTWNPVPAQCVDASKACGSAQVSVRGLCQPCPADEMPVSDAECGRCPSGSTKVPSGLVYDAQCVKGGGGGTVVIRTPSPSRTPTRKPTTTKPTTSKPTGSGSSSGSGADTIVLGGGGGSGSTKRSPSPSPSKTPSVIVSIPRRSPSPSTVYVPSAGASSGNTACVRSNDFYTGPIACTRDGWLDSYTTYDLACPDGEFVEGVTETFATVRGQTVMVQISITCSGGALRTGNVPRVLSTEARSGTQVKTYSSASGFREVSGAQECTLSKLDWYDIHFDDKDPQYFKRPTADNFFFRCVNAGNGDVITSVRVGAGEFINNLVFCCGQAYTGPSKPTPSKPTPSRSPAPAPSTGNCLASAITYGSTPANGGWNGLSPKCKDSGLLTGYATTDFKCPTGHFVVAVAQTMGFVSGTLGVVQMTISCSDGVTNLALTPSTISSKVTGSISHDDATSSSGFRQVTGYIGCIVDRLSWNAEPVTSTPTQNNVNFRCAGTNDRITSVRLGFGQFINSIAFCCSTVGSSTFPAAPSPSRRGSTPSVIVQIPTPSPRRNSGGSSSGGGNSGAGNSNTVTSSGCFTANYGPTKTTDWNSLQCAANGWMDGYQATELACPSGKYVQKVTYVTGDISGFNGLLQITVTCNDGTQIGPLPTNLWTSEIEGNTNIETHSSVDGFRGASGWVSCQVNALMLSQAAISTRPPAANFHYTCLQSNQRITSMRVGTGPVVNSVGFCCSAPQLPGGRSSASSRSEAGFNAIVGSIGCQVGSLRGYEEPPSLDDDILIQSDPNSWIFKCPSEDDRIAFVRVGAGVLLNSLAFCCTRPGVPGDANCLNSAIVYGSTAANGGWRSASCRSNNWLQNYQTTDLRCPAGTYLREIGQVQGTANGSDGVLQVTLTCSDGTTVLGPLPATPFS